MVRPEGKPACQTGEPACHGHLKEAGRMDRQNFPHSIEFCPFLGPLALYRLTITVIQSMIICLGDKPTEKQKYANSRMLMPTYKFLCY